uniref:coiled-coil domain-containing protein 43 n=1 Tax=Euleptes europaea TaxID=460621 RepID=UPI00253FB06B|nr:coiled-coil domain-containing protein 43 [Euleptes europaea]
MAARGEFGPWLEARLEALGLDGDVYGGYVRGLLREAESDAERLEGLEAALAAGEPDEDVLQQVCREIVKRWSEAQDVGTKEKKEDEIQAIASMIEKQAQIVVKPKEVSKEETLRKAALLAQYAEVTDEEDEADGQDVSGAAAAAMTINSEQSLFKNTNLTEVVNARKLEREHLRDESQRKKEQDKLQREKDKLAKQERKEKEKKRTQKGERKR